MTSEDSVQVLGAESRVGDLVGEVDHADHPAAHPQRDDDARGGAVARALRPAQVRVVREVLDEQRLAVGGDAARNPVTRRDRTACRTAVCVPCACLTRRVRWERSKSISEASRAPASRTASSKTASMTSSHDSRGVSRSRMRLERSSSRVLRDSFSRSSALLSASAAMWQNAASSEVSASLSGVSITQSTPRALSPAKSGKTTSEPVPGGNPWPRDPRAVRGDGRRALEQRVLEQRAVGGEPRGGEQAGRRAECRAQAKAAGALVVHEEAGPAHVEQDRGGVQDHRVHLVRRALPGEVRPEGEQRGEQRRARALRGQVTIGGEDRLRGARRQFGGAGEQARAAEGEAADRAAHGVGGAGRVRGSGPRCRRHRRPARGSSRRAASRPRGPRPAPAPRSTAARRGSGRRSCDSPPRPVRGGARTTMRSVARLRGRTRSAGRVRGRRWRQAPCRLRRRSPETSRRAGRGTPEPAPSPWAREL